MGPTIEPLEQDAELLSLVVSKSKNVIIIIDAEGRIRWVNESFKNITGYTLHEALGKRISELLHGPLTDPVVTERMRLTARPAMASKARSSITPGKANRTGSK